MFKPHRIVLLAFACLFVGTSVATAQQGPLEIIPDDATFAFGVRNMAELRDKGEKFVMEHHLKLDKQSRPTALFESAFRFLKITKGLDEKGAAVLFLSSLKKNGVKKVDLNILSYFIVAVPFTDADAMASNFGFKAGALKPGTIEQAEDGSMYLLIKGKHLFLSISKKALKGLPEAKPLSGGLTAAQRTALGKSDMVFHLGPQEGDILWQESLKELTDGLKKQGAKQDDKALGQMIAALKEVRFVLAGLRLDDGLALNLIASFPKADEKSASTKFLTRLRAGPGTSDLLGLPAEKPLFVYAAKGHGGSSIHILRALMDLLFDKSPVLSKALSRDDWHKFLDLFESTFTRLTGSRAAIYHGGKHGSLAAVAILDLEDPEAFQNQWPKLVESANKLTLQAAEGKKNEALQLTYKPKAETIEGVRVDLLKVQVPGLSAEDKRQREALLGPDWNRILFAVQDKSVVVLLGSERDLLKTTLRNRQDGKAGLAKYKPIDAALARMVSDRKLEFHANADFLLETLDKGLLRPVGEAEGLTSLAVAVELDRLQLDIVVPKSEVKAVAKLFGVPTE